MKHKGEEKMKEERTGQDRTGTHYLVTLGTLQKYTTLVKEQDEIHF